MKKYIVLAFAILFAFSFAHPAQAAKVVMIVKNATSLSHEHERTVYDILVSMGHDVTLVDKNVEVNYTQFNIIVVAGRPFVSSKQMLDSFVANLPVNEIPTLGIESSYLVDWGWVKPGGISSYVSSQRQSVFITSNHPITKGFTQGQKVYVHSVQGKNTIDLVNTYSNLTFVASIDTNGKLGSIGYALPNTQLYGGKKVSNSSVLVYFGITYPLYWTDEAITLFKNSINWLLNFELNPPSSPVLTGPSSARTSTATYQWTEANDTSGIQYYQFQLSNSKDFNTTLVNVKTTSLAYTVSGLEDGKIYYARVRALDWYGNWGNWSNTIQTIADFSDLILSIISPPNGTELHLGDEIFVDVEVNAPRLSDKSNCTIRIGGEFISNLTYNQTLKKCSGNITIPNTLGKRAFGFTEFSVSATNSLGSTNSSSILVFFNRSIGLSVSTDKTSYLPGENVTVHGEVFLSDNKAKVSGAKISYSVSGTKINGTLDSDANGLFSFILNNLTEGFYTIYVNATYGFKTASNSTALSITQQQPTSYSTSSSFVYAPILSIEAPSEITAYENSSQEFFVRISNEGTTNLLYAKVLIAGINFPYEVSPITANIGVGKYQDFKITLHIPKITGSYQMEVKGLAYDTFTRTKKVKLNILPKILIPVLEISALELPSFSENEISSINVTISNIGNATAEATLNIFLPERWSSEKASEEIVLEPNAKKKISFLVLPSNTSGKIKLVVDYFVDGEKKSLFIEENVTVKLKPRATETPFGMITSMIVGALSKPEISLSFLAIVAIATGLAGKFLKIVSRKKKLVQFQQKIHKIAVSSYNEWERKYKKSR